MTLMQHPIPILYRDEHLVAVDKPAGLLVHRSPIAADAEDFLVQRLRRTLGQRVYTAHRLDRPTSGVMVFGLTPEAGTALSLRFERREVHKRYLAVVRGWTDDTGEIDYALADAKGGNARAAVTRYRTIARVELPFAVGPYATSRYSLLLAEPFGGRYHQIRRHFHHIFHPLIGDTTHGEGRHNRLFRDQFGINHLLLHALGLRLAHPFDDTELDLLAPLGPTWCALLERLGWAEALLAAEAGALVGGDALPY